MNRDYFIVAAIAVLLSINARVFGDTAHVRQIEIKSRWGGLGTPRNTELTVQSEKGIFKVGHRRVDATLVETLVRAISEAPVPKPELQNLGITQEWLNANAEGAAIKNAGNFADAAANQKTLYTKSFTDVAFVRDVVPSLFNYTRFDDYPGASVVVTFEDGSTISAASHSWYLFMMPWEVTSAAKSVKTYNADISRAVAALLPKNATNRYRLAGEDMAAQLSEAVMRYVENDWKLLDVENRAGDALRLLRTMYTVKSAEINPYHHPEYGKEWKGNDPHETNLHLILQKDTFPSNIFDAVVLLYENGKVDGVDEFLRSGTKYETLATSVPWLKDYITQNPRVPVRISYVHDASFGDKAMQVFAADMHAVGREEVVPEVRAKQHDIALLMTGITYAESYWLAFPDGRLMLWRYGRGVRATPVETSRFRDKRMR